MIMGITVGLLSLLLSPLRKLAEEFDLRASQRVEKELALEAPKRVKIENGLGKIALKTWNEPRLKLEAIKRAKDASELQRVEILIEEDEASVLIRARAPEGLRFVVEYTLLVPQSAELEVKAAIGEVSLEGVESGAVALGIGSVKAPQLKRAKIEVGIGSIELTGTPEDVSIDTGMGEVELRLPADASLLLRARTGVGSIDLSHFAAMKLLRHEKTFISEEIEGVLGAGEGIVSIEVGVGGIEIKEAR